MGFENSKEYKAAIESQKRLRKALEKEDAVFEKFNKDVKKFTKLKTK